MSHTGSTVGLVLMVGMWLSKPQDYECGTAHSGSQESGPQTQDCKIAKPVPFQLQDSGELALNLESTEGLALVKRARVIQTLR